MLHKDIVLCKCFTISRVFNFSILEVTYIVLGNANYKEKTIINVSRELLPLYLLFPP